MTNGEKLVKVFPDIDLYKKNHSGIQINFDSVWWNAEYKEPTTPNDCETCIHNKGVLECDMYGCKYEPTTKNDVPDINVGKIGSTTKNDLGVDCISRDDVRDVMQELWGTSGELMDRLMALPSVTPQEPKTGHCKNCKFFELNSWAKVDGIPLIVAHEICKRWGDDGCKTKEDGYCFLFEPQESEE